MTTKEIRQQMMDRMNGKVMAGPDDDPFEQPMTFNGAVRAAEGFMEELGVVGHFSLQVQYDRYSTGLREISWRFYCFPTNREGDSIIVKSQDCEAGLADFRSRLVRHVSPCSQPDGLAVVGSPSLESKGN